MIVYNNGKYPVKIIHCHDNELWSTPQEYYSLVPPGKGIDLDICGLSPTDMNKKNEASLGNEDNTNNKES